MFNYCLPLHNRSVRMYIYVMVFAIVFVHLLIIKQLKVIIYLFYTQNNMCVCMCIDKQRRLNCNIENYKLIKIATPIVPKSVEICMCVYVYHFK